jgi:hypothetical protein
MSLTLMRTLTAFYSLKNGNLKHVSKDIIETFNTIIVYY